MDTELTVAIAQILTGTATLVVAIFLAGQLILQRKVLDRAHDDAERDLAFSAAIRRDSIVFARLANPVLEETVIKGMSDLSTLDTPTEMHRFQSYARLLESCLNYDWTLGRDDNTLSMFQNQINALLSTSSMRTHYRNVGRSNIHNPELRKLMDELYEQLEETAIENISEGNEEYSDVRVGH